MFTISTVFFRLLNFFVLGGVGWFLFKKYVKSGIEEKITQKEALLKGLEEQGYFLEGRVQTLENSLKMQEARAYELKQKIDQWNAAVLGQKQKRQEEYKTNVAKSIQKIATKNVHIANQQWRMHVIPEAIKKVSQDLSKQFADTAKAKAYVHDIVTHLEGK